ncbi:hypothetical protein HY032_03175, partial [Candidatus Gottesmanbacteria bacterium]|nr:hypothetical protein [Candidatus Gottesmanbacteria bacterium]
VLAAYLFFQLHTLVVSGNALFGDTPRGKRRYEEDTRASLNEDSTPESVPGFKVLLRRIFSAPHNGSPARRFLALFTFHFSLFTPIAIIAIGLGVMYSSFLWQRDFVDHKMRASFPLVPTGSYVMYPLRDFIAAMKFIQDHTSRDTVILSETTAGNYLPVYAGNTVYVGHDNTVDAENKQRVVRQFFSGRMSREQAKKWLQQANLRIVFFGPQEREDGGVSDFSKVYPFLKEVYKNNFVTVYHW